MNEFRPAVTIGARIFAAQRYRLSTLTVPSDLIVAVTAGRKELHTPSRSITAGQSQAVLIARGTQWDVVNDPYGQQQYEALVLGFDGMRVQGKTDFGTIGYGGACPPAGDKAHRYIFTVHALKTARFDLPPDASAAMIGFMIHMNKLSSTSLEVTYGR